MHERPKNSWRSHKVFRHSLDSCVFRVGFLEEEALSQA